MFLYKNFYTNEKKDTIGLVIGYKNQNCPIIRYNNGYVSESLEDLEYNLLKSDKPLIFNIKIKNNEKYLYFPELDKEIIYDEICDAYKNYSTWTIKSFCPAGYEYSFLLKDSSKDIFDFIKWLSENFNFDDYHISRYYNNLRQVGHNLHLKHMDQINLIKLMWSDLI